MPIVTLLARKASVDTSVPSFLYRNLPHHIMCSFFAHKNVPHIPLDDLIELEHALLILKDADFEINGKEHCHKNCLLWSSCKG